MSVLNDPDDIVIIPLKEKIKLIEWKLTFISTICNDSDQVFLNIVGWGRHNVNHCAPFSMNLQFLLSWAFFLWLDQISQWNTSYINLIPKTHFFYCIAKRKDNILEFYNSTAYLYVEETSPTLVVRFFFFFEKATWSYRSSSLKHAKLRQGFLDNHLSHLFHVYMDFKLSLPWFHCWKQIS